MGVCKKRLYRTIFTNFDIFSTQTLITSPHLLGIPEYAEKLVKWLTVFLHQERHF